MEHGPAPSNIRELNLLHRISKVLGFDLNLSDVLQVIASATADLMDSKIVSILLYDDATRSLSIAATQSLSPAYRDKPPVSVDNSVSGRALRTLSAQAVADLSAEPDFGFPAVARQEGVVSLLCVPMVVRGQAIGVINSYSPYPRTYTEEDITLLSLVAGQAAIAIDNARLQSATAAFQEDLRIRRLVGEAKAVLMKRNGMAEPEAHRFLQKESMNRRKPIRAIAEAILLSEDLKSPSTP